MKQQVVVTDFDMSFGRMVSFMVKLAIAAIPATLILGFCVGVIAAVIAGFVS